MKQIKNSSEYFDIVDRYRRKGCLTNDYIQQDVEKLIRNEALFCECYENNAFFFVQKNAGMRMYFYINDISEIADFKDYGELVTEVLFRTNYPAKEVDYLTACGFSVNLIRDQYAAIYSDLQPSNVNNPHVIVEPAQTMDVVELACQLFNKSFDRLSGDFIDDSKYPTLLQSNSILIAWDKNKENILGALHQQKEGLVNVISHVAVFEQARGHGVGKALVDAFIERNKNTDKADKTRYQLWVQRLNNVAVRMYQSKGFHFTNKSTISLTK